MTLGNVSPANIFVWVLIAFPAYLLVKGRISTYVSLAETAPAAASQTTAPSASHSPSGVAQAPGTPLRIVPFAPTPGVGPG